MVELSSWLRRHRALPIALGLVGGILIGTAQSFADKGKDEAVSLAPGRLGKTVFLDVGAFGKKDRAARRMTKLHQEYAEGGWSVVDVAPYIENGDLEGFFITYIK